MALDPLQSDEVLASVSLLLRRTLAQRQQHMLTLLATDQFRIITVTMGAKHLAHELSCAESTVWDDIKFLRELGVVSTQNRLLHLTPWGLRCLHLLRCGI